MIPKQDRVHSRKPTDLEYKYRFGELSETNGIASDAQRRASDAQQQAESAVRIAENAATKEYVDENFCKVMSFTIPAGGYASIAFSGIATAMIVGQAWVSSGNIALLYSGYAGGAIRQSITELAKGIRTDYWLNLESAGQGLTIYADVADLTVCVNVLLGDVPTVTYTADNRDTST